MNTKNRFCSKKGASVFVTAALIVACLLSAVSVTGAGATVTVDQTASHATEASMYLYTLSLHVANPANLDDCDKDAINELRFTFTYKDQNGYGENKTYTLDMSYKDGKNQNSKFIGNFQRHNDNAYWTTMQVWVPGLVSNIKLHLNMDGGERLNFSVEGVYLNGYRLNKNVDYVSSAYYDSNGEIRCALPPARVASTDGAWTDCYGGVVGEQLKALYEQDAKQYGVGG